VFSRSNPVNESDRNVTSVDFPVLRVPVIIS
jgi:hypothetical protein